VTGSIPDVERLAIEEYIDPSGNQRVVFHFPFGRRVNDALSRGYAYRLSNMIGSNVSVTMSDDNFMIGTPRKIDINQIPGLLTSRELDSILRKAIKDSEIFKLRFRHTAARSFMILRNYLGRPISVNRQQVRSSYLLDMLGSMENVPVIEETYREVLEDDMDIKSATEVLEMIENGKMCVDIFQFSGTPSPFAHSIILSGFSDIVLMEDRSELLKELHRKVLYRALGDSVKEFEFDEDHVIPYFRQKIGRITSKSDIVPLLARTGPLQAVRERGRNIYSYCDDDKKIVDEWVRELLKEGAIGTVFMDEPHIMVKSEVPVYAAATAKERELNEIDQKVLGQVGERTALSDITAALEISEDVTFRSMRKLESMYLVTRTDITANNKWYFSRADFPKLDRNKCLDEIVLRHLECFAPSTVPEIAFSLSITEKDAQNALDSLVNSEEAVKGQFLISQSPQYMKVLDRMRLRAGKENVFDFDTVEEYRRTKGEQFKTIEDYFKFYGSAGSEIDVYNRVKNFRLEEWYKLRESEKLLLGRFVRGRVRYVLAGDGDRLATLRQSEVTSADMDLLAVIEGMGHATMRQLVAVTGGDKAEVKESIQRLDRSLKIIRAFTDREDWGTENTYKLYRPKRPDKDPTEDLVRESILSYGPIPGQALRFLIGVTGEEAERYAASIGAATIFVGGGQNQMYVMPEEVPLITRVRNRQERLTIRSLFDPDLGSKWAELSARYGDRWIYPATKGNKVVGALEIWEMSGCIEVRSMDIDSPELLQEVLEAVDRLMGFFNMKGVDIVRIREVLGTDAAELDEDKIKCLKDNGYKFVNGFYAKGRFIERTMSEEEFLCYVFQKQRVSRQTKYSTVGEAVKARGYIRNDQEMVTRVFQKTTIKKVISAGGLFKMTLLPGYVGYTTADFAPFYRAAKAGELEKDAKIVAEMIRERQPISRKEIIAGSPFSEERTLELVSELSKSSVLYQDQDSYYYVVPVARISREEALKAITRRHFKDFGTFSAEELALFISVRMSVVRKILSDLEKEGFLVKGFLMEDDATLRWMLKEDAGTKPEPFKETFLLNTQDNLHIYLRERIKAECGATECVVLEGTKIIGSFSGKLSSSGAKVENFKGSDKAHKHIRDLAKSLGVKIEEKKHAEEEDWDVSEFYLKTNPGAI
jgi:ATP-dependent Lhr-like helicase